MWQDCSTLVRNAVRGTILYFNHMSQEEVILIIYWLAHIHQVLIVRVQLFRRVISVLQFTELSNPGNNKQAGSSAFSARLLCLYPQNQ